MTHFTDISIWQIKLDPSVKEINVDFSFSENQTEIQYGIENCLSSFASEFELAII